MPPPSGLPSSLQLQPLSASRNDTTHDRAILRMKVSLSNQMVTEVALIRQSPLSVCEIKHDDYGDFFRDFSVTSPARQGSLATEEDLSHAFNCAKFRHEPSRDEPRDR